MIAPAIDALGSALLAHYVLQAAWNLLFGGNQTLAWLAISAGIRLGLTFKIAATLLLLSNQPDLSRLGQAALIVALRLLIRSRTVETARQLAGQRDGC